MIFVEIIANSENRKPLYILFAQSCIKVEKVPKSGTATIVNTYNLCCGLESCHPKEDNSS